MGSGLVDRAKAAAIEQIAAGLDALVEAGGAEPESHPDAIVMVRELERVGRRLAAQQVAVVEAIDRRGFHRHDAHASAKVMDRHLARVSDGEAGRRFSARRVRRELPAVWAGFVAGDISRCHLDRVARAMANPRVRTRLVRNDDAIAELAAKKSYQDFDARLSDWIRMADEDGTADTSERNHENRSAAMLLDPDGSWRFGAVSGSNDGAEANAIFLAFVDAERLTDWDRARAVLGDAATADDLPRTEAQRRHDAWLAIMRLAADSRAAEPGGSRITTNIVIDHTTFERHARRLFGQRLDPRDVDIDSDVMDAYRCHTLDGHWVDPTEAVANALIGEIRRVVFGADSVTIDLGRRSRLFRGPAALAARLGNTHCYWPGCSVPVSRCQIDHVLPWTDPGSRTHPGNGGPACGKHNRRKEHGFTVHRDKAGTWHVHRPDGTEID